MTIYYLRIKEWFDRQPQAEKDKLPTLLAGVGLGLVLAQSTVFLGRPVAGYIFIAFSLIVALLLGKKITLGPKYIYIPLLIIVGTVVIRTILYDVSIGTFEVGFISLMFCGYLAGRVCGRDIFFLVPIIVITLSILIYIQALLEPGIPTGGLADPYNYNLSAAVLALGTVLSTWKRKWVVVAFTLPALFLTGGSQSLLVFAVLFVMMLVRRDFSPKILLPVGALSIAFLSIFYGGLVSDLYARPYSVITQGSEHSSYSVRLDGYKLALSDFTILGHGYEPTITIAEKAIHNVPLRVYYELGPVAAIAWCYVMLVGLIKTRYKYAFATILAFSIFDHLMWTYLAPVPWIIAGVATIDKEGDLMFRKETI